MASSGLAKNIIVKGAREHNLKNVDVIIPRNKLVVITGVSGSGKSSLAFDTIYAEGQRRYVESLSSYARQFLGRMDKPEVDYIEGLSPAISIDQKGTSHNPRSTVGTVTEIYDYLRLLFARIGTPHCYKCGRVIQKQTVQQIADSILSLPEESKIQILAPVVRRRKGEHKEVFESARRAGFVRVRVNGETRDLSETFDLDKQKWHNIDVVVDRLVINSDVDSGRVTESAEAALSQSDGLVMVDVQGGDELIFSEDFACVHCNVGLGELEPRTFSFNNPHGACNTCTGLGFKLVVDPDLVIPDKSRSITDGGIVGWARSGSMSPWYSSQLLSLADSIGFDPDVPINKLTEDHLNIILNGTGSKRIQVNHKTRRGRTYRWRTKFEGVINNLERRHTETESESVRKEIERYMTSLPCQSCQGQRLRPEALAVTINESTIMNVTELSIRACYQWTIDLSDNAVLTDRQLSIASQILKEISARLEFLLNVGLDYLTLSRTASTLSGGEAQRIRLATQIGSGLMGVLYVCDEPSIGLHPADDDRLINTLKGLRDVGNTVLIVEHDEAIMRAADHIVDLGPGAGEHGGQIVASGTPKKVMSNTKSLTGQYLSGKKKIAIPTHRRTTNGSSITIKGASQNNLKNIDIEIPLGIFVCITGVSGSGKSTLINEILHKKLAQHFYGSRDRPGSFEEIDGIDNLDKVVNIDQSPIGRTPRSNPATYTGTFTPIRELFSQVPEARSRGYKPGRFSFNVKGGRCEACSGDGQINIEMQFLPDVSVPCEECDGNRYNREALEILYRGFSIADVLSMTVTEAVELFSNIPRISNKLQTLKDVGLGYIKLGQPATQLSGGEAQRVKLATELSKRATGQTLYILDEPTTGLSFEDCAHLLKVMHRLVDSGNSVVLIEHHLDLIKNADWLIDMGPGAGDRGGEIVCVGTPEEVSQIKTSHTGYYLHSLLTDIPVGAVAD
ncbi:MAG: excinuclease ABC subunit UvrA [SAR202 cluster bacterium]|nr:MAG: excinuclease ABC subunit UvrA [SAR202 cluster bacterium]MCH2319233.1 excinuclease ABC subunit UvrA [SAR202 cluster bacterium]MQG75020.1 excinuclease ABC subunit UvrA [SAR202 cluster bacterium]